MINLKYQFELISAIRNFFTEQGFMDVLTPPIVENPGMETHIHPFQIKSINRNKDLDLFLHTSPEFAMKRILSDCDYNNIFTIGYSFRDEPDSDIHRKQFLMCEWYRKNVFYTKIMEDCELLIKHVNSFLKRRNIPVRKETITPIRKTVQEIFQEVLNIDILSFLEVKKLKEKIVKDYKDVPLPTQELSWDDYYFLLFLNKVEPELVRYPFLILYNFPHHLRALSTINSEDSRVCDRFEIYMNGIEVANCFNELTIYSEQKRRFEIDAKEKWQLYKYKLPKPQTFYSTLEKGLPKSAGIALGIERLLMSLTNTKNPFFD